MASEKINATYDSGFDGISFFPENYNISDEIVITPKLKLGYDWVGWTGDITTSTQILVVSGLTKSISIRANSKPGYVDYKVNHYLMKIGGNGYDLIETERYESTTGTKVYGNVKEYIGFKSPEQQSAIVKNDSSTEINYYYTRNKHFITVQQGTSSKYEYWYQEKGDLRINKNGIPDTQRFKNWQSNRPATITNIYAENTEFLMPDYDVDFFVFFDFINNRLNSNIFKNIFPKEVLDLEYIEELKGRTITSYYEIRVSNHGFQVNDVLQRKTIIKQQCQDFYDDIMEDIMEDIIESCPQLTPISMSLAYTNNGHLQSGQENVQITISGGVDGWDRQTTYTLTIFGCDSLTKVKDNVYNAAFSKNGVFPVSVVAKSIVPSLTSVSASSEIVILPKDHEDNHATGFYSGGLTATLPYTGNKKVAGGYIDKVRFDITMDRGHSSTSDQMYIIGFDSNNKEYIVKDRFTAYYMMQYFWGDIGKGNLGSFQNTVQCELKAYHDIRKVQFKAYTAHTSCTGSSVCDIYAHYHYDKDLYLKEVGMDDNLVDKVVSWKTGSNPDLSTKRKIGERKIGERKIGEKLREHKVLLETTEYEYLKALAGYYKNTFTNSKPNEYSHDVYMITEEQYEIAGVVVRVKSKDVFTLVTEGQYPYPHEFFKDSTVLYLSDKEPGKMVHYKQIDNLTYIPIAIYTEDSIIVNILDGTSGAPFAPYNQKQEAPDFERYSVADLDDIIGILWGGPYDD